MASTALLTKCIVEISNLGLMSLHFGFKADGAHVHALQRHLVDVIVTFIPRAF